MIDLLIREMDGTYYPSNIKLETEVNLPILSIWIDYADLVDLYYRNRSFACGSSDLKLCHPNNIAFIRKDNHIAVIIALYQLDGKMIDSMVKVKDPSVEIVTFFYHSKIELLELQETLGLTIFGD